MGTQNESTYYIAFVIETDGEWDIVDEFESSSDAAAEQYAETHYAGQDWYVLDSHKHNINA